MDFVTTIPGGNGTTTLDLQGVPGTLEVVLAARPAPTTGTLRIQVVTISGQTMTLGGGSAIPLANLGNTIRMRAADFGQFVQLIFTVTGAPADGSPIQAAVTVYDTQMPDGLFTGTRAMTVQTYTETNTKRGTQFWVQPYTDIAALTGIYDLVMTTGALPVIMRQRELVAATETTSLQVFRNPTSTGGVAVPIYNANDINPTATTVAVQGAVTTTATGTPWGGTEYVWGQGGLLVQRAGSSLPPGVLRILAPNSKYLFRLANLGAGVSRTSLMLSWSEGQLDLPRG